MPPSCSATADITMMLVGNKTDLASARMVSTEEGKEYAASNKVSFMEASALTASNVEVSHTRTCVSARCPAAVLHRPVICVVAQAIRLLALAPDPRPNVDVPGGRRHPSCRYSQRSITRRRKRSRRRVAAAAATVRSRWISRAKRRRLRAADLCAPAEGVPLGGVGAPCPSAGMKAMGHDATDPAHQATRK